jgi:hypothetical protein
MPVGSEVSAVSMMTSGGSSSRRIARRASRPDMPGIRMSSSTTSKSLFESASSASSPEEAGVASNPIRPT